MNRFIGLLPEKTAEPVSSAIDLLFSYGFKIQSLEIYSDGEFDIFTERREGFMFFITNLVGDRSEDFKFIVFDEAGRDISTEYLSANDLNSAITGYYTEHLCH